MHFKITAVNVCYNVNIYCLQYFIIFIIICIISIKCLND